MTHIHRTHGCLFRTHVPAAPLDRFIENFWLYRGYGSPHPRERILQDGSFKMVFNLAQDEFRIYDAWQLDRCVRHGGAIVSRPSGVPFVTDSTEEAHVLGVNFRVGGALPFLGRAAGEITGTHIELGELWGSGVHALQDRLVNLDRPSLQFRLLESALLNRLAGGTRHHPAVELAVRHLGNGGVQSRTREVARLAGLSERRFIEVFKAELGMTPQLFGRVRRFQRVLARSRVDSAPRWSAAALDCGYFDQSHMIRDFIAFSGFSPADHWAVRRQCHEQGVRVKHNHVPLIDGGQSHPIRGGTQLSP
jgi:AraC-like DNA-binding protein